MKINKLGFTLLELLVVVLIVGILAAIALPQYQMAVMKSRYSAMMDIVNAINDAEERYYLVHDKYSETFDGLDIDLECTLSNDKKTCSYDWGNCGIVLGYSTDRVHCHNNSTLKNAYVRYLKQGKMSHYGPRNCITSTIDINDKYNKLCKNMGAGRFTDADYCQGIGDCVIYKF